MALINCSECGKEVSENATTCPNCGNPINKKGVNAKTTAPLPPPTYEQIPKKICKHCKAEIPKVAKVCPNCNKKQSGILKWVIIGVVAIAVIGAAAGGNDDKPKEESNMQSEQSEPQEIKENDTDSSETKQEGIQVEEKDKYHVGDIWENKTLRMTYTSCYEFTDYNQYNAPADGNKIICAEFEFENIGNSDTTVMYTDFHGYADGYEVDQSYAPEGTGLDFSVKMSSGRKGTGKVAFEVPENAQEIEIEFSPNFWTSENIIFVYE